MRIEGFFQESNFWLAEVVFEGETYLSIEHAYLPSRTSLNRLTLRINGGVRSSI